MMSESQFNLGREHLETLYEITRYLNSSLELQDVLEYVMDRVIEVTGAERGFLVLFDPDTHELTFPIARGMGSISVEDPEFHVSHTIIQQVVADQQPLLTIDAQHDERFSGGSSVITKGFRSVLCVPITVREEMNGLVYVENRLHVGRFNETHRDLLAAFASQAGTAIENARLYQVAVEKGRLQQELEMASRIQRDLLPRTVGTVPGYEIAFDWRSAREVAGDFYDCFLLNERQMAVVVADVADKGAPAALYMAVSRSLLRASARAEQSPAETVRQANRLLIPDSKNGMFVTMYYSVFEVGGRAVGVNAGHNLPVYYHAETDDVELLPRGGRPLGLFEELPVEELDMQMMPGDAIVFYTDGLTEAENQQRDQFGEERLAELVRANGSRPAHEILQALLAEEENFVGEMPNHDDLTVVVVRYVGQ